MPGSIRLIARLDLKMDFLIKGVHFEGWRKIGNPGEFARRYYQQGIDELIYMDVVASLYGRNNLSQIIRDAAEDVFIPITAGGGVRNLADVKTLLSCGADKVAINTAATLNPTVISRIADTYGSQAVVLVIECRRLAQGGWEAMTDNGRNHTGREAVAWAAEGVQRGAGEILLSSIDADGTGRGLDVELASAVSREVDVPVIVSGGVGCADHVVEGVEKGRVSAVAMASALHYNKLSVAALRTRLRVAGIQVRSFPEAAL